MTPRPAPAGPFACWRSPIWWILTLVAFAYFIPMAGGCSSHSAVKNKPPAVAAKRPHNRSLTAAVDGQLRFSWTAPCRLPVYEKGVRGPMSSETSFVVVVKKRPPDGFTLTLEDLRVHKMAGRPIDEAEGLRLGKLSSSPALHLKGDGTLESLADFAGFVAKKVANRMGTRNQAAERAMQAAMSAPAARRSVEYHATERWRAWMGFWLGGGDLHGGRRTLALPLADGSSAKIPFTLVAEPGPAGRQRYRATLDKSRDFKATTAAFTTALGDHLLQKWGEPLPLAVTNVEMRYEVLVESRSHRVEAANYEHVLRWGPPGRAVNNDVIRWEWRFDWKATKGCGTPH